MGGFAACTELKPDAGSIRCAGHALACRVGTVTRDVRSRHWRSPCSAATTSRPSPCLTLAALAESLGACRYQALLLCVLAETRFMQGDLEGAQERNARALVLARERHGLLRPLVPALAAQMLEAGPERERCATKSPPCKGKCGPGHS
jgi:hypothetical protein